jgi:anti-sigma-K factor RskA
MDKEQFLASGLLEQYVLGITTPNEARIVEEFVEEFPEIKAELRLLQNAMDQYAAQHAVPPPSGLKEKVMREIGDPPPPTQAPLSNGSSSRLMKFGFALSLVALLVTSFLTIYYRQAANNVRQHLTAARTELTELRTDCEERQKNSEAVFAQVSFMKDPNTAQVLLEGISTAAADAKAFVYWNEADKSGYLNLGNLPPPPAGKTYQIWADVEGVMIDAGVVNTKTAQNWQSIRFIEKAESLNITIEPEGGSDHPTVALLTASGEV